MRSNGMTERKANRTYTAQQRAEAVGLALAVGPVKAGESLGIPVRTVASWTNGERKELAPIIAASRQQIADRLWETVQAATEAVLKGLQDPHARLSDKARALEVAMHSHALLTGAPTERTETSATDLTLAEEQQLADWIERQLSAHADPTNIVDVLATTPTASLPELLPGPMEGDDDA